MMPKGKMSKMEKAKPEAKATKVKAPSSMMNKGTAKKGY